MIHVNSILGILTLSIILTYMHVITRIINPKTRNICVHGSELNWDFINNKQHVDAHFGSWDTAILLIYVTAYNKD